MVTDFDGRSYLWPICPKTPFQVAIVICCTTLLCYLAATLGGTLVIRPEMIWPVWPGCALLVALLLLSPRKLWPALLIAGLSGFVLYDVQENLSVRATALLLLADTIEILVAALGVRYVFRGVPRLNSIHSLAEYAVFSVFLAPVTVASIAASALKSDSWWISFFTEALALLTLTPALLSWAEITRARANLPKTRYVEAGLMSVGLGALSYFTFVASGTGSRPAMLYSLVPFLLWAALRFGIAGTSNSLAILAFVAILGTVEGRGPFGGNTPVHDVLTLQLFLLFAASSFMVLASVVEKHKTAEQALQSREELLNIFVKNVPAAVAMLDRDMHYLQVSDRWCADFSVNNSEVLGRSHYEIFPDLPDRWKEIHRRALKGETLHAEEDRWDREGETIWSRWEIRPWKNVDGTLGGVLIFSEDISHRKQMEEKLLEMSRKLIASQEQERARIGRELHDDVNQQLAILALEMQQLVENPSLFQSRGLELRKRLDNISADVQALSHDLHSSKLEYLGVVAGIRSWCKEFAQRQKVDIDFTTDVSNPLPMEIGLTFFRVLQEALHNAVKHSGALRIEVRMRQQSGGIELTINDSGKGFDVEQAMQGTGLGLTSMQERVRLVDGTITIDSKPTFGTSIHVHVPLPTKEQFERAAG